MLRPGGWMLYSTCTFSPEENEEMIAYLLETFPELEVMEIPWYEGFAHGMPELLPDHKGESFASLRRCVRIFPHKMDGEGHFLALLKKSGELSGLHGRAARGRSNLAKEEEKVLRAFLQDVSMLWSMDQIESRGGQVYLVQEPSGVHGGIPFLRNGLYLGELKKNRFEPSQSFAMALKGTEYASVLDFDQNDERLRKYLQGETIMTDDLSPARAKGWQLVCVNGYPLGWGKLSGGTLKNKYHPGWRMQQ
jgi:NOL1/NOP2/fmu family ribosome biogenesis protein